MASENSKSVVSFKGLRGGYDGEEILRDLSLDLGRGGFTAIAGPNGVGKSTLLKYLFRELKAQDGAIKLYDIDINSLNQKEIARLVSFQGQFAHKSEDFTVREVVAMGRFAYNDAEKNSESVDAALEKVGIAHLSDKLISCISGGEFQLAMLARTICQDAGILALDEPVNNLDPKHQIMLLDMLKELSQSGKTVLCVLHDLNAILRSCDRTILMKDGTIFAYGKTEDVLTQANIKEVYDIDVRIAEFEGRKAIVM